ncbi:MAG: glycosyltransferase family 2 protein [Oscillospiraceae bacterium]|nr:glycosyltransferase family 2 protein [Oscillospiraceae bacterium]
MIKISYVIPCYGSESTIKSVVDDVKAVISTRSGELDYEIVLVNDYSPDDVWDVILKLSNENPKIRGFCLSKNFGQHAALMAGYKKATGDIIISLDDDGQTPASESLILIDKINEGYDVVYGRYRKRKDSSFRKFGTYVNKKMAETLVGKPKNVEITSFYALKRYVALEMVKYENSYPYIHGLIFRTTSNCVNVTIEHEHRVTGKSGYTLSKLLSLWLNGFTSFSVKPLRIATVMGFICSFIGFIFIIYTIIERILNPGLPAGYAITISILLLVGGIIMGMLGIIGEYIGRLYISINKAPQYIIKDSTDRE